MSEQLLHILLADSNETDQQLFCNTFNTLTANAVIHFINNGPALLEWLYKNKEALPTILFLDLNLPIQSGIRCLQHIRSHKIFDSMSVSIYTASVSEADMDETFLNGANNYIIKSSDPETLKQLLQKAIDTAHLNYNPPFSPSQFVLNAHL